MILKINFVVKENLLEGQEWQVKSACACFAIFIFVKLRILEEVYILQKIVPIDKTCRSIGATVIVVQ